MGAYFLNTLAEAKNINLLMQKSNIIKLMMQRPQKPLSEIINACLKNKKKNENNVFEILPTTKDSINITE